MAIKKLPVSPACSARAITACVLILALIECGLCAKTAYRMRGEYAHVTAPAQTLPQDNIEFMKGVAERTEGKVVLNNFDDNSVWMYPSFGINALIKGRPANQISSMSDDLYTVINGISDISTSSEVRDAASRIGLKYVTKMSDTPNTTTKFNALNQIDYQQSDSILKVTPDTPGFKLIYELNGLQLFEVLEN